MILNYPSYEPTRWQGTLLMWAVISIMFATNLWGIRLLPIIELLGGICHIAFFIMILVALVVLAPQSPSKFVFTEFVNGGGWQSNGVSWSIGLLTVVYCFVGNFFNDSTQLCAIADPRKGLTELYTCQRRYQQSHS